MKTHRLMLLVALVAVFSGINMRAAAQDKSWAGELVMNTKPPEAIQISEAIDGKETHAFTGLMPILVLEERDGRLKIHDGKRKGWVAKSDFVLVRLAPAYFSRRIRANPKDTFALFMRGTGYVIKGDADNAIKDFDEFIRLDPRVASAFNGRGNAWLDKKQYDKAIQDYDEAIRLDSKSALFFRNRGNAWNGKKQLDMAIKDYDEAIRLNPEYSLAYADRAFAWNQLREFDKAINDFTETIRLDPKAAFYYTLRGMTWQAKKDYVKAFKDFDEAIRLNPKDAFALEGRGIAWNVKKEHAKALQDFDKAIRLDPKNHAIAFSRAVTLVHLRKPEAVKGFRTYLDSYGWKMAMSPYAAIFGHFSARQAGTAKEATLFSNEGADKTDPAAWPYPVFKFLKGEIDGPALLKLATDKEKRTEAHCYLAWDHALKGNKKEALTHFRWVKDNGVPTFIEYTIALAELERLERSGKEPK